MVPGLESFHGFFEINHYTNLFYSEPTLHYQEKQRHHT